MRKEFAAFGIATSLLIAGSLAESAFSHHGQKHADRLASAQPSAGQQARAISSFSDEEIAGYRDGRGMGLARPAELNGYPGPMHVLELAAELDLTSEQRQAVETIFARMKETAQAAGARYLEAEAAVDAAFRSGGANIENISGLVRQADGARAEFRLVHLKAHLETASLLSADQRRRYAELRGYTGKPHGAGHQHGH